MTEAEFARRVQQIEAWRENARRLFDGADALEMRLWRDAGIYHVAWSGWSFAGHSYHYATPHDAFAAKRQGGKQ